MDYNEIGSHNILNNTRIQFLTSKHLTMKLITTATCIHFIINYNICTKNGKQNY